MEKFLDLDGNIYGKSLLRGYIGSWRILQSMRVFSVSRLKFISNKEEKDMTVSQAIQAVWSGINGLFGEIHKVLVGFMSALHIYTKIALQWSWKVAILIIVVLFVFDIIKSGFLPVLVKVLASFAGITLGGGIAIVGIAIVIGFAIAVFEKTTKPPVA